MTLVGTDRIPENDKYVTDDSKSYKVCFSMFISTSILYSYISQWSSIEFIDCFELK